MWAIIFCVAYILQGGLATYDFDKYLGGKICGKSSLWDNCLGCNTLGGGLKASKLGCFGGSCFPSFTSTSLGSPTYLPMISTCTSQVPVFKSYYKPIFKTRYTKIPVYNNKLQSLMCKFPCLKKKLCLPGVATSPFSKLSCLKGSCLKPNLLQPSCCSPYSTFC